MQPPVIRADPELHEPVSRSDLYDLRAELADLHARVDALVEAVHTMAREHYRPPYLPEGRLSTAIFGARRR
jgi:hypothetical protein